MLPAHGTLAVTELRPFEPRDPTAPYFMTSLRARLMTLRPPRLVTHGPRALTVSLVTRPLTISRLPRPVMPIVDVPD